MNINPMPGTLPYAQTPRVVREGRRLMSRSATQAFQLVFALAAIVGGLAPWIVVQAPLYGPVSFAGHEFDEGKVVIAAGVSLALAAMFKATAWAVVSAMFVTGGASMMLSQRSNMADARDHAATVAATVGWGWGVYLAAVVGVLAIIVTFLQDPKPENEKFRWWM